VVHRFYEYDVESSGGLVGTQWTLVTTGPSALGSDRPWSKTWSDGLGRTVQTEQPKYPSGSNFTTYTYYTDNTDDHSIGALHKVEAPGRAPTVYEYNEFGEQVRSGLDINDNGDLDPASSDRINTSEIKYELADHDNSGTAYWWRVSTSGLYPTNGVDSQKTIATTATRLTGLAGISGYTGDVTGRSVSIDIYQNKTVSTATTDRSPSNRAVKQYVNFPDVTEASVAEELRSETANGLLQSTIDKAGVATSYGYDELGRQETVADPRTGTTTTAYYTNGDYAGNRNKVKSVTDADNQTTTYYYSVQTGRQTVTLNPDNKYQYFAYDKHGRQIRTWGETTYPVE
jgi:YD repeat-containing protein